MPSQTTPPQLGPFSGDWSLWLRHALSGQPETARIEVGKWLKEHAASDAEVSLSRLLAEGKITAVDQLVGGLLNCGANPMEPSAEGTTPLMAAAARGDLKSVELLLPASDAKAVDNKGFTALIHAARFGQDDCARALIPSSDTRAKDNLGNVALVWAARFGSAECVTALLPSLSDWAAEEAKERVGQAMGWAASLGYGACVELLLPHGGARWVDSAGKTPLMMAAQASDAESVKLLIPQSDAQAVDQDGRNALSWATEIANSTLCFEALLPVCDAMALDREGRDVFAMAMECDALGHADLLADRVPIERLQEAVFHAPDTAMPRARALIERAELTVAVESREEAGFAPPHERRRASRL